PVLRLYPVLQSEFLAVIARTKSEAHRMAIAKRQSIAVPVSDVLLEAGGIHVAREVAANAGAVLSSNGFEALA
ncbi:DUF2336 domain-containing protein, partial [Escherichia coli]|uniref:DUF2336 domain-containing protein n=1 Tax=Escherichia coli TaxID=562 RepID=UPI0013D37EB1